MKSVEQYLERYAEAEAKIVQASISRFPRRYDNVVTIPLVREGTAFAPLLRSLSEASYETPTLGVFIVNGQEKDRAVNAETMAFLGKWAKEDFCSRMTFGAYSEYLDLLVVNRATSEKPFLPKEGVGLARKIVGDLALELIEAGVVRKPWIFCTDGDVAVDSDYFHLPKETGVAAYLAPYRHRCEESVKLALYDLSLRYYEMGLRHAGSPYAFQTLGSTLILRSDCYAMVRGFPKREAGEDFYILNKLAKVGRIVSRRTGQISIEDRPSDRVPFGTGAAVGKMDAERFEMYHPASFDLLKVWLSAAEDYLVAPDEEALKDAIGMESFGKVLESAGVIASLKDAVANRTSTAAAREEFHRTFDAFRTLKLVHAIRDALLPKLPWEKALLTAEWLPKKNLSEHGWMIFLIRLLEKEDCEDFSPLVPSAITPFPPLHSGAF